MSENHPNETLPFQLPLTDVPRQRQPSNRTMPRLHERNISQYLRKKTDNGESAEASPARKHCAHVSCIKGRERVCVCGSEMLCWLPQPSRIILETVHGTFWNYHNSSGWIYLAYKVYLYLYSNISVFWATTVSPGTHKNDFMHFMKPGRGREEECVDRDLSRSSVDVI